MAKEKKVIDSGLTAYEVQQQQYASVEPLDPIEVIKRLYEIADKMLESNSVYFMMLCHELRDYTTIVLTNEICADDVKQFLLEALQNRGTIMDMYDGIDGGWDIWIKDSITGKCHIRKIFDATDFVEII